MTNANESAACACRRCASTGNWRNSGVCFTALNRASLPTIRKPPAIRGLAQKLDAIDHEVGSLHERARLLLDELDAKMTTVTNRRLFTLSILTACLLPPTLVTGFFGMNTKDMPFQDTDGGTWMAALVALAAGLTCYWALRRLRAF